MRNRRPLCDVLSSLFLLVVTSIGAITLPIRADEPLTEAEIKRLQDMRDLIDKNAIGGVKDLLNKDTMNALVGNGQTPLVYAIYNRKPDVAAALIAQGADVNFAGGQSGSTALHAAAWANDLKTAKLLLEKQADVHARDNALDTPLHCACQAGNKPIAEALILAGAKVKLKNKAGTTPLHLAVSSEKKELVELLVAKGAFVNEENANGDTALNLAAAAGNLEIVEVLVAAGTDLESKNMNNRTAADDAKSNHHREVYEFLMAKQKEPKKPR